MAYDVVGIGLTVQGWRELVRFPVTAATPIKGLTEKACNAVHDLGAWGATVAIVQRIPSGQGRAIDDGECPCDLCRSAG